MKPLIGEWIANIAVIAILGALVDVILPNSSLRKYTGFLFGLVILVMFLQPIMQIWDQTLNFETLVFRNALSLDSQTASFHSSFSEKEQKEQLEKLFKKSLEKDLTAWLNKNSNLKNASADITFSQNRNQTDLSSIDRIEVWGEWHDQSVFIKPIKIDLGKGEKVQTTPHMETDKTNEVKRIISDMYNLETNKIFINRK